MTTANTLEDRILFLIVGALIGFIAGYVVRSLRDISDKVDEVEELLTDDNRRKKNQHGFMRNPWIANISLLIVLTITVYAAFQSQRASNNVHHLVECSKQYNLKQGASYSSRDQIARANTATELRLWTTYLHLYREVKRDSTKIKQVQRALNRTIKGHVRDLRNLQKARHKHPYPDPDVLKNCAGE